MKTILTLAVVLFSSLASNGGLVARAAAEGRTAATAVVLAPEVSMQRGTCVGNATASCYAEHGRNRRAATACLALRIDACEEAYASLPIRADKQLALGR